MVSYNYFVVVLQMNRQFDNLIRFVNSTYINQIFHQFMIPLLINDTWRLCFEKSQRYAVFPRQ
jgi:hypothetical protein